MFISRIVSRVARELENRRSIRLLSMLSDHDLDRMGLVRGDVEDAVRGGGC